MAADASNRLSAERTWPQPESSKAYTVNKIDVGDVVVAIDGVEVITTRVVVVKRRGGEGAR